MTQQHLDDANVRATLEQVRDKAVPQRMNGDRLAELSATCRDATGLLQSSDADRLAGIASRKQPSARTGQPPIGARVCSSCGESMT